MKPVILGAGLAGLTTALALSPLPVILVSPCKLGKGCSSSWAQGGIAAALGSDDHFTLHREDTLAAGNGLNDASIVEKVTQGAPALIKKLADLGVPFERDTTGHFLLGLEAAHKKRRIVHAKDATGLAIMETLISAVQNTPSVQIIENASAQDLLSEDHQINGVVLGKAGTHENIETRQVVLATGGAAALWRDTTNPHENWGSGLALAARVGATLGDLEFMQFHPTAIDIGRDPMPLASEALRGEGAVLINETGARFIDELFPRDVVARAIWEQIKNGHRVFLDARQSIGNHFPERFPTIHTLCISCGIDPVLAPIPIRPASHYHMGGVLTDSKGRTDIKGLWACGEVACTGLHGANRLASNSLLEAMSFGESVAQDIQNTSLTEGRLRAAPFVAKKEKELSFNIRNLMSTHVGVIREATGLKEAINFLSPLALESDIALVGLMIAQSALRREESRGAHYRLDFPETKALGERSHFRLID